MTENLKRCARCGFYLDRSNFNKTKGYKDGLSSYCSPCKTVHARERRMCPVRNETEKAYRRKWYQKNKEKVLAGDKRYREDNKEILKARRRQYELRNRKKMSARRKLNKAVESGVVLPKPCVVCGAKGQAHHDDYSKPLGVTWLCPTHHAAWHRVFLAED